MLAAVNVDMARFVALMCSIVFLRKIMNLAKTSIKTSDPQGHHRNGSSKPTHLAQTKFLCGGRNRVRLYSRCEPVKMREAIKVGSISANLMIEWLLRNFLGHALLRLGGESLLELFSTCYHGTIDVYSNRISDKIDISVGRHFTDFGQGFYVTSNYKQAVSWAAFKYKDNESKFEQSIKPSVIKFTLDLEFLSKLKGLMFDMPSDRWAEFIYNCRKAGRMDRVFHEYDYVCGPLADGKTAPLVSKLIRGSITLDEFHDRIKPKNSENQLSLHNDLALESIRSMEVFTNEKLTHVG